MQKSTHKRIWALAGLAFFLFLTLTILPGISYHIRGPWYTDINKVSRGLSTGLEVKTRFFTLSQSWKPGEGGLVYRSPEGFYGSGRSLYFRFLSFEADLYLSMF